MLLEKPPDQIEVGTDAPAGFDFRSFNNERAITQYLEPLAKLDQNGKYDIKQVAANYKDKEGKSLVTFTAPTRSIMDFANGSISREQFLRDLEGQVNFVEVARTLAEAAR